MRLAAHGEARFSMQLREMVREDRAAVLELLEHAFGVREIFERYMDFDPAFRYGDYLLAIDGDQPVACLQIFRKTIGIRGTSVLLGGIGSVATRSAYRRRGLASKLLERAIRRMRELDMSLSLLFTGRAAPLYERLGWQRVPVSVLRLSAAARTAAPDASAGRSFELRDLPRVKALYSTYTAALSGPTLRDATYWAGQLRTAGSPGETFRIRERDGVLSAYARSAALGGCMRVIEYARAPSDPSSLAELLVEQAHRSDELVVPCTHDLDLIDRLRSLGARISFELETSPMWRVLDRERLAPLTGVDEVTSDEDVLQALMRRDALVYWLSDRF